MPLPSKQMIEATKTALNAEYGHTNDPTYDLLKIKSVNENIALVIIRRVKESTFGVATSIEHAREYADKRIRYRLKHQTDTFDGEYLLRHISGDFDNHLSECPTERQKHERVGEVGLDLESAVRDYRAGFRHYELEWIANAVNGYSGKSAGDVVYWRIK